MILPDLNLLIFAYNRRIDQHERARAWWQACLQGSEPIGMPWAIVLGFVRLTTNRRILTDPWSSEEAIAVVRLWCRHPLVAPLEPGPRHLELLAELLHGAGVAGPLTSDAHLAALAIEHGCRLYSNDADFGRFPGLVWNDPLA